MPACSSRCLTVPCVCTCVCLCVCVFKAKPLQAVIVPETHKQAHLLSTVLFLSTSCLLCIYPECWVEQQHPSLMYSLYTQHKAQWISLLISIRHLVLSFFAHSNTHTRAHTHRVLFSPPPHSVMQITGFVVCCQCVANTEVAGVCGVAVLQRVLCWGCLPWVLQCTC